MTRVERDAAERRESLIEGGFGPIWLAESNRTRLDAMKPGMAFVGYDDERYRLVRVGLAFGPYFCVRVRDGADTIFAGCSEGILEPKAEQGRFA